MIEITNTLNSLELSDGKLTRLDNSIYSYKTNSNQENYQEVRIETPQFKTCGTAYKIAHHVFLGIKHIDSREALSKIKKINIDDNDPLVKGAWNVSIAANNLFRRKVLQNIPMFHVIADKRVVHLKVEKPGFLGGLFSFHSTEGICQSSEAIPMPQFKKIYKQLTLKKSLKCPSFHDPFTQLAASVFQTCEPYYVTGPKLKGKYQYLFDEGVLTLIEIDKNLTEKMKEKNQEVVAHFKKFIIKEYGEVYLKYAQGAYGFNFDEMIEAGEPLLPDHVFKVNIGVNNIELAHAELLYRKLQGLVFTEGYDGKEEYITIFEKLIECPKDPFAIRELRKLSELFLKSKPEDTTWASFVKYIGSLVGESTKIRFQQLPIDAIHVLISILVPQDEELSRLFTGREISHLSICSYPTMGDQSKHDPCRDLFELLHVFPQLKMKNDWFNWQELLAHVVVKKKLIREHFLNSSNEKEVKRQWRVGTLLPAPNDHMNNPRWYYVEACVDDDEGNLNYVLLPVSQQYKENAKPLPMIKLYRSTASAAGADSNFDSMAADLNPWGGPASLSLSKAEKFEKKYFDERTIPAWVGHYLLAEQLEGTQREEELRKGLDELIFCLKHATQKNDSLSVSPFEMDDEKREGDIVMTKEMQLSKNEIQLLHRIYKLKKKFDAEEVCKLLYEVAAEYKELPKDKISQDIFFVGHSLGAALAQVNLFFWGARRRRIPMPSCSFQVFALDGPAITKKQDKIVKNFMSEKKALLKGLGQKWKIEMQFEYGDFVPQAGERHLGTGKYDKEVLENCLDMNIRLFKPLEESTSLDITTMPTHGRRVAKCIEGKDIKFEKLLPEDLLRFHVVKLPHDLKEKFGYKLLTGPAVTDTIRKVIGVPLIPILQLAEKIDDLRQDLPQKREKTDVFFTTYTDPQLDHILI